MAKKTFKELISGSDTPVLVDFYADWCGPCKAMSPELESFARANSGKLKVIKVNVDKNQSAAMKYQVRGVPTLILFSRGELKWRQSGALNRAQLEQQLANWLN